MTANDAKNQKRVKNIKRLLFAKQSMLIAVEGCDSALSRSLTPGERTIYSAGIAAMYASPFMEANELGALEQNFSEFPNKCLKDSHNSALQCRHELFAHRDMTASGTNKEGHPIVLHRVYVEISASGQPELLSTDIKWRDSVFGQMKQLCQFQLERLDEDFKKLFAELSSRTKRAPGVYELGVSYP